MQSGRVRRAGASNRVRQRGLALALAAAVTAVMLVAAPASAEPSDPQPSDPAPSSPPPGDQTAAAQAPPFSDEIDAASAGNESIALDAVRFSELVVASGEQLARLEVEALAAADANRLAEADLAAARAEADQTRTAAEVAQLGLREAQDALESFARDSYLHTNGQLVNLMLLLESQGPRDLLDRVGLLDLVGDSRTDVLTRVLTLRGESNVAQIAASDALVANLNAQADAQARLDESTAMLAQQQALLPVLLAQYANSETSFYSALVTLLGPEGAAEAYARYEQDQLSQHAAEAAARAAAYGGGPMLSGSWAAPVQGRFTSCFCMRWGTMHWGIDIAAPMYTPEYSVGNGVVVQAGPATGFGQAVYIQHDNGDVTVYGHMEVIEVVTGQRVVAGQVIALLGTQGFSTGPHLHFEVHVGGIGGARVDPVQWLAARGIFV